MRSHPLTHDRNIVEQMDKVALINRYHVEQFAKWMARLEAAEDGERSLLDNSMIVYARVVIPRRGAVPR